MNSNALFHEFPVLKSDHLILREIEDCHLEELYEIYSNDNVFEYCGIIPKHKKDTVLTMIGHFKRDYLKKSRVKWGMFPAQQSERLVGIIEAFEFNQRVNMATIGYFLAEAHWGKGFASEAVQMVVRFLMEEVNVNRIQAEVMPKNEPSKQVLRKNGFTLEGTLRQAALWSGKGIVDLEIYGLLQEDYQKRQTR
ncbi:GNAT family protein [Brevibacillus agri]|uniref:GNAT family N-acetyltransferase n=1 Tax=Brevibacillus TaxID=55080 RepID=UPI00041D5F8F|nr:MULTISPECIES: GNAT family protein [Brevibacillus]MBG9564861.1 alanine acetyltransferase [Brevibacillus agri]MED1642320.1 GNAT family protein [Brevibacillus agri]MED1657048.1 GNAT family protein [Brevibacillus agri]MED1686768.1 GNAT family protein [Brevibacillus agri]MED1693501.1 GNAT family protein [Brevibacillus agri]